MLFHQEKGLSSGEENFDYFHNISLNYLENSHFLIYQFKLNIHVHLLTRS